MALRRPRGQVLVFVGLFLPVFLLALLLLADLAFTADRVRQAVIAADLAAHAGTQAVAPSGLELVLRSDLAVQYARASWSANAPPFARLDGIVCAAAVGPEGRPGCEVRATVFSPGFARVVGLSPQIPVRAVAYALYGVDRALP